MRGTHGLALTGVLAVGVLVGVFPRGGVDLFSEASPGAAADGLPGVNPVALSANVDLRSATALGAGDGCSSDDECPAGLACLTTESGRQCRPTCQNDSDCDDGYFCTDDICAGAQFEEGVFSVCHHPYSEANCGHLRETHRVRTVVYPYPVVTIATEAQTSVGISGTCHDENLGQTVPPEECVFTVEAVQYRRYATPTSAGIKFNAVCVDTGSTGSALQGSTCSPVEREPLALGVGLSIAPAAKAEGGAAAGLFGAGYGSAYLGPGLSIPILVQRRLRYPLVRRHTGRAGGNILIESGIGSIVAHETVVFNNVSFGILDNQFCGNVRFFVTKPVGMHLTVGYAPNDLVTFCGSSGHCNDLSGLPVVCPPELTDAFVYACGVNDPLSRAAAQVAIGPLESDFDIQEVIDALNNETQAIADITEELKGRIKEKITKVFEILQGYLGSGGGSAASAQRSVLVDQMMNLLRDRITNTLDEIRGIARDLVACPQ